MTEVVGAGVRYRVRLFNGGVATEVTTISRQKADNLFEKTASMLVKKEAVVLDRFVYGKRPKGEEGTCTILSGESIRFCAFKPPVACAKSKKTSKKLVVTPAKKTPTKKVKKGKK
jgi:hypothetical protein